MIRIQLYKSYNWLKLTDSVSSQWYISCINSVMFVYVIVGISKQERGSISGILDAVKTHTETMEAFRTDHSCQVSSIEEKAKETFRQQYAVSDFYTH